MVRRPIGSLVSPGAVRPTPQWRHCPSAYQDIISATVSTHIYWIYCPVVSQVVFTALKVSGMNSFHLVSSISTLSDSISALSTNALKKTFHWGVSTSQKQTVTQTGGRFSSRVVKFGKEIVTSAGASLNESLPERQPMRPLIFRQFSDDLFIVVVIVKSDLFQSSHCGKFISMSPFTWRFLIWPFLYTDN